jgi:hypothetical protein
MAIKQEQLLNPSDKINNHSTFEKDYKKIIIIVIGIIVLICGYNR